MAASRGRGGQAAAEEGEGGRCGGEGGLGVWWHAGGGRPGAHGLAPPQQWVGRGKDEPNCEADG